MRDVSIYGIVFVVMLIIILLQINLFNTLTLVGTTANLGVVLISSIGLITGKERGAALGGVYGLMLDILEGQMIGLYLAGYLLLGYICGRVSSNFSKDNRTTAVAFVGIGSVAIEAFIYLASMFLLKYAFSPINFAMELGKEAVYNMFLAIISFKFLYGLCDMINRTKSNYYLL